MKNKIKIISLLFIVVAVFGTAKMAAASSTTTLSFSPSGTSQNVGTTVNASLDVNTGGDAVCTVGGTIVFNNISCQDISLADGSGTLSITSPTCSNPEFIIGIKQCTTADKALFNIKAAAGNTGSSSINVVSVKIIGAPTITDAKNSSEILSTSSIAGVYNIESSGTGNGGGSGNGNGTSTNGHNGNAYAYGHQKNKFATSTSATSTASSSNNRYPNGSGKNPFSSLLGAIGAIGGFLGLAGATWISVLTDIILILLVIYVIYEIVKSRRNKKDQKNDKGPGPSGAGSANKGNSAGKDGKNPNQK